MHLTAAKFVLLNAFFTTALPHPAFPKLPGSSPSFPTTPGGIDVPNFNDPNQNLPDPGRWVEPPKQNPDQGPDTSTNVPPNTAPGLVDAPKDPTPDTSGCILSGKKRGECTPNSQKWDALPKGPDGEQDIFSAKGKIAIDNLDNVRTNPPAPKPVKTNEEMDARYKVDPIPNQPAYARILSRLKNISPEDLTFTTFHIRNRGDDIDAFIDAKRLESSGDDANLGKLETLRGDLKNYDAMVTMQISIDRRSMVIDRMMNQKYDLHRKYPSNDDDHVDEEDENLIRAGSDADKPENEKQNLVFTEQVIYSLKKQYDTEEMDPRQAPMENIVYRNVETAETNIVIEAAMSRAGKKLDNENDAVSFNRDDPEFEAIMGTIHGERMLQMLKDHADILGPRRIKKVSIMRDETSIADEDADFSHSSPTTDWENDSQMGSGSESEASTATPEGKRRDHDILFELEDIPEAE